MKDALKEERVMNRVQYLQECITYYYPAHKIQVITENECPLPPPGPPPGGVEIFNTFF